MAFFQTLSRTLQAADTWQGPIVPVQTPAATAAPAGSGTVTEPGCDEIFGPRISVPVKHCPRK